MLTALLVSFVVLLITWALIYPGGPLGYYLLYRVSSFLGKCLDDNESAFTHVDGFGALCVVFPNNMFWINHKKRTHHLLLEELAKAVAMHRGYKNGVARVTETDTSFRFTGGTRPSIKSIL